LGRADISGLGLHRYDVATELRAHLAAYIGVGAITTDKVEGRNLEAFACVQILGGGQDSTFFLDEVNDTSAVSV
jgi:hypothetical protein